MSWTSSHIEDYAYDENSKKLTVTFKNGAMYDYHDVTERTFEEFKSAPSKGNYLHNFIKGKYYTQRVI